MTGHGLRRRLQHRRLCELGPDGGQPRAGARLRPLLHAATTAPPPARSTPTGRSPAPSAASACRRRRSCRRRCTTRWPKSSASTGWRSGWGTRCATAAATVTGQRLEAGVGIADCLEALEPHWQRALADAEAFNAQQRQRAPRRRRRVVLVWLRQHLAAQPLDDQGRHLGRRHGRAAPGRGRHRPGLEHGDRADRRRRARPAARGLPAEERRHRDHARRRQDLGLAPDLRHPARRRKKPRRALREEILRFANVSAAAGLALRRRGAGRSARAASAGASTLPRLPADADGFVFGASRDLRPADHAARRQGPGQALRRLRLRRPDRRARGRHAARHREARRRSPPRTTSAGRSTRCSPKARSRAASRKASAWR